MFYEPQLLDKYLVRCLKRLNEDDSFRAIKVLCQRIEDLRNEDYYLSIPVEELPLSTKASNALSNNYFDTVKQILDAGWDELKRIRGIGPGTLGEIRTIIEKITAQKDRVRGLTGIDLRNALLQDGPFP